MSDGQIKILLLDDDYESMKPLKRFLEVLHGFSVELTADAGILARLATERFDLLCVDIMIQRSSSDELGNEIRNIHYDDANWQRTGIEFFRRFRRGEYAGTNGAGTSPNVPVLFLSAVAEFSVEDVLDDHTDHMDYLEKPFDVEEYVGRVNQLLEKAKTA